MNKTTKTMIVMVLTIVMVLPIFASGAMEKGQDFKTLDLSTASISEMENAWQSSVENYTNQKKSLKDAMSDAYQKRDVSDYLELRSLYFALEVPAITEEQTETLVDRINNTNDKEEKDKIASFLFENSRWYHPTLTFKYSVGSENISRTLSKTYSTVPGSTITVPILQGDGVFLGWSEDGENVIYKGGEEMEMPYSDTVLYAVFSSGITFKDSVTGLDSYFEGTEAVVPELKSDDPNMVFLGWYDERGRKVEGDSVTVENGRSKEYTALWRGVEIGEGSIRYYEEGKIPSSTKVVLFFPVSNKGNTALNKLNVSISGDGVDVLSSSLNATIIGGESNLTASYVIYTEGEKGEEKVITATVKDSDGNLWTKDFKFIVQ